jgi:hypothetical protein
MSLKSQSANSARRGEIRAKRTTKQPMRPRYPFGVIELQEVGAKVGGDEKETE